MTFLLPGERIDGTTEECAHQHLLLACFRASPPRMRLPDVTGAPLPVLLDTGIVDKHVFNTGYDIMARCYEQHGIGDLLPLAWVWVGTRSTAIPGTARSYGGFHHPAQGFRHLQMDAAVTVYGDLSGQRPVSPQSAALDLVRSYAHDCLHYATFRRYRLTDRGEIARAQYGINFRRLDGRTYSAPDGPDSGPTRNLGIVMEGATDAEATAVTRRAAKAARISAMNPDRGAPGLALAGATGALAVGASEGAMFSDDPYARSLGRFNRSITMRYQALLAELARDPAEAHGQFLAAMISGDLAALEAWLGARHGQDCFTRLFRARPFGTAEDLVS